MGRRGGRGGGRGGGEDGGGGGGGGGFEDQYGEGMVSQDRGDRGGHAAGKGGGFSGGGEAGAKSKGPDLKVASHVPAFLRPHAHLLHGKGRKESEPAVDQQDGGSDSDFERDDGGALARAIAENPALAAQDTSLQRRADKAKAEEEKASGNRAFGAKEYDKAVAHFTVCIRLDPENEVFYSNRSAALLALDRHKDALADARKVVELRPSWAKGYARLGAAFFALEHFTEAKEAYRKALDLEPEDVHLQNLLHRSDIAEHKAMDQRKHRFRTNARTAAPTAKRARTSGGDDRRGHGSGSGGQQKAGGGAGRPAAKPAKGPKLSFEEDD